MIAVFVGGYLSGDRHPPPVVNNVTVLVAPDGVTTSRSAPRKKSVRPPDPFEDSNARAPQSEPAGTTTTNEPERIASPAAEIEREISPVPPPMTALGPLVVSYPKPMFIGRPVPIRGPLRAPTKDGGTVTVPAGTHLLSRGMPVTSSDTSPLLGELSLITDGDKSAQEGSYVELAAGLQWVQIDLKEIHKIEAVAVWHFHLQARAYDDVIILISNDPEFKSGVLPVTRDIYTGSYFATDPKLKLGATVDRHAREHGLIARFIGDRIAFSPPLIITEAEIDEVMLRLRRALDDTWKDLRG